ncbi:MAG: Dam family site-specific DNA-(adenine-N6)-methyltransferase [Sphingomonadales bacterium]|nr:Dam family site-specific DNA-(adenine-N6)-methyltransferase [Sphingomonadales bacterium]
MTKVKVPPIKSQGIKTKLVPWISSAIPKNFSGRWIEPFLGTGVVALNLAPNRALLCDLNPHLIKFYQRINEGEICPQTVRTYLESEGQLLRDRGESHYYYVRDRFNDEGNPLDFLFVNRAGFNGMIRFNKKGGFNIPFCRKPNRFAQAYVTKIVNQVAWVFDTLRTKDFEFVCQSFQTTIRSAHSGDIIYCDPPYIGRHADYFSSWDEVFETELADLLTLTDARFILSSWHHNDFRKNEFIETHWSIFNVATREHFYHVGGKEANRNPVIEAMITNFKFNQLAEDRVLKQFELDMI